MKLESLNSQAFFKNVICLIDLANLV